MKNYYNNSAVDVLNYYNADPVVKNYPAEVPGFVRTHMLEALQS